MCTEALIIFALLFLIIFIITGFVLPTTKNKAIKERRKIESQEREKKVWGFHSRHREGPWLNFVDYPVVKCTEFANEKRFYSDWLIIHDGYIIVNPGEVTDPTTIQKHKTVSYDFHKTRTYAWDGCTPKKSFFWIALVGTPDWWQKFHSIKRIKTANVQNSNELLVSIEPHKAFWPLAHHASLIHDALYQYLDNIPISKQDVDLLFKQMLIDAGMFPFLANIYHFCVMKFGGRKTQKEGINPSHNIEWKNPIKACRN